jgi:hypothetical protein
VVIPGGHFCHRLDNNCNHRKNLERLSSCFGNNNNIHPGKIHSNDDDNDKIVSQHFWPLAKTHIHSFHIATMKTVRSTTFLSLLLIVLALLSANQNVMAQDDDNDAAAAAAAADASVECDCNERVESAKAETSQGFHVTIDELKRQLEEAVNVATSKDGEIASLGQKVQDITNSMTAQIEQLKQDVQQKMSENEAAQKATQASKDAYEKLQATLHSAKEEATAAKQQVSKYVNQRFFVNISLLKQDFNSLLKKLGIGGKNDDL